MSAYVIVQINIIKNEPYQEYLKKVTPVVHKYKGQYIVRGGKFERLLGKWDYERTVVIKFPSYKIAMEWHKSDDYAPIKKIREDNSDGNLIIIEGL